VELKQNVKRGIQKYKNVESEQNYK